MSELMNYNPTTGELVESEEPKMIQRGIAYSSIENTSFEDGLKIAKAVQDTEDISDYMNKKIKVRDIIIQNIGLRDGEVERPARRCVVIDDKGKAYACVSEGVISSLQTLISCVGEPKEWEGPIEMLVSEAKTRAGFRVTKLTVC